LLNSYFNETSVIGSLLISPEVLEIIEAVLTSADFEDAACRETYLAALSLRDDKKPVDAVLLGDELKKRTGENMTGWLIELMQNTPTAANVEAYCRLVKEDANKRRLSRIAEAINENTASESGADWREIASEALEQINEIEGNAGGDVVSSLDMANDWMEYYDKVVKNPEFAFCRTGYSSLDRMLGGGMFRQGMYIVGARPGMGKTTLGINIAENIAKRDSNVLFVSMEMSRTQIMAKRIAIVGGISYTKLMNGSLADAGRAEAIRTAARLSERPFSLVDKSKMTIVDIGRAARQVKGLSAIVVDYLGLIRPEDVKANKPRYEEMTDISADLKALAKLLGVPIMVLCQLNRENSSSSDKRPQLQHLRDSGAIEQDADGVILLHRPEYYNKEKLKDDYVPPALEEIELIVAKNRHGETGLVKLSWRGVTGEIKEFDTRREEPRR
jgi:replicative DNA helicase